MLFFFIGPKKYIQSYIIFSFVVNKEYSIYTTFFVHQTNIFAPIGYSIIAAPINLRN